MKEILRWWPVIVTLAGLIGTAAVIRADVQSHETRLTEVERVIQSLDKRVDRICIATGAQCGE